MPRGKKKPDFEESLARLEDIVNLLEEGELPLEQSLKVFEEGVALTRQCQSALQDAEQKVALLTEQNGAPELQPLADDESFTADSSGADE